MTLGLPHGHAWAMRQLRAGHRVRRRAWVAGCHLLPPEFHEPTEHIIVCSDRLGASLWKPYHSDFYAYDWQRFEP